MTPRRAPADTIEALPFGDRWIADAFRVMPVPAGFALRLVDMTQAKTALALLRSAGVRTTFTHAIVRAAAVALARHPDLHRLVCGYRRVEPAAVDIGLSMAGRTTYAPVVVLAGADRIRLPSMALAVSDGVARARAKELRDLEVLRRWGALVPFGFLRRFILRILQRTFGYRRRLVGTFQVSCLASVDIATSFLFYTGSILGAGSVRDRVVAHEGRPAVRPTCWLSLCVDHVAMDGQGAARLLKAIKGVLEGTELVEEARTVLATRAA